MSIKTEVLKCVGQSDYMELVYSVGTGRVGSQERPGLQMMGFTINDHIFVIDNLELSETFIADLQKVVDNIKSKSPPVRMP